MIEIFFEFYYSERALIIFDRKCMFMDKNETNITLNFQF